MKVCRRVGAALTAPPETPPSRRHAGRAARRQPAQCRASSAPARSAASSDLSATSDTSNARSGANCSSGPEVNEKKLCKRAFCPPRKSAKLMLVISPEELPNATTAPFASTACNAVANDAPPADLPQFDRRLAVGRIDQCEHLRLSRPSRNNDHAPHRPKRDPIRRGCSTCRTNPANSRHRAPRAQRRARKCSGSRYHSKEAYLWPTFGRKSRESRGSSELASACRRSGAAHFRKPINLQINGQTVSRVTV